MPRVKNNWKPYLAAREYVRALGLKKQQEYEAWSKSGNRPSDIPGNPAKAYGHSWGGWADFLGTQNTTPRRSSRVVENRLYAEAKAFIHGLKLQSQKEYAAWSKTADRPFDIPSNPYLAYAGEWENWSEWLGLVVNYRPFIEARAYARSKSFKTRQDWNNHSASPGFPEDIPQYPEYVYRNSGWIDWPDWLGVEGKLTRPRLLAILNELVVLIPDLGQAELYTILEHKNIFASDSRHTRIEAMRAFERLCHADDIGQAINDVTVALSTNHKALINPEQAGERGNSPLETGDYEERLLTTEEINRQTPIPKLRSVESLKVVDRLMESGLIDDTDVIDFLVDSRISSLWQKILDEDPEFTPENLFKQTGGQFFDIIRTRFIKEHHDASTLPLPTGYAFQRNGRLTLPNLMQRLTALRLKNRRRLINYSGVGAGKTLSAVYGSQVIEAKVTIIIALNATLDNWKECIQNAFPIANCIVKEHGPFVINSAQPNYIILNYESFQQHAWSDEMVKSLCGLGIDLIVLDEIQSVRLRGGNEESNRRRRVRELILGASTANPKLHVLGLSATPVMNDLHEARTLLELVSGQSLEHLPTRPTVSNAILYHQQLTRNGIRHLPNYKQSITTSFPQIDGTGIIARLSRVRARDVLSMEQAVFEAKLPTIIELAKPGTLLYTTFVRGIVDPLKQKLQEKGLRVGTFTGDDKEGYSQFLNREVDVLIGSEPIGTGVDKLQSVADRLIFVTLPWTSAHFDQIVGRLHRQGSQFEVVEVFVPIVELRRGELIWSWDRQRHNRIQYKRTLSDAAVDGVIPEGKLPSQQEMQAHSLQALQSWIKQVGDGVEPTTAV